MYIGAMYIGAMYIGNMYCNTNVTPKGGISSVSGSSSTSETPHSGVYFFVPCMLHLPPTSFPTHACFLLEGFTSMAKQVVPKQVMAFLNRCE